MNDFSSAVEPEQVLVFHRGALGDVLLGLPFLAALPLHFKAQAMTLVGRASVMELLAGQPFVAGILDQDRAVWLGLYGREAQASPHLSRLLRDHRAAVVFARDPNDPLVTGLKRLGLNQVLVAPSRPPADMKMHLVDHMFAATGVKPLAVPVTITPSAQAGEQAEAFLKGLGLLPDRWVSLHPGSGGPAKVWPLENWLTLADRLNRGTDLVPLFVLGPAEAELGGKIAAALGADRTRLAENLPLPVLAACLGLGRAHVGLDSGVTHLAAALGRPTLALFGPTDSACWAPRGSSVAVLSPAGGPAAFTDWAWLTPERVLAALRQTLS